MSSLLARGEPGSMSYQPRISIPPFTVIGRTGALGNTKRRSTSSGSSGTMGSKSVASAPRPCIQITHPTGLEPVSFSRNSISSITLGAGLSTITGRKITTVAGYLKSTEALAKEATRFSPSVKCVASSILDSRHTCKRGAVHSLSDLAPATPVKQGLGRSQAE